MSNELIYLMNHELIQLDEQKKLINKKIILITKLLIDDQSIVELDNLHAIQNLEDGKIADPSASEDKSISSKS